jgi:hypothetical protein
VAPPEPPPLLELLQPQTNTPKTANSRNFFEKSLVLIAAFLPADRQTSATQENVPVHLMATIMLFHHTIVHAPEPALDNPINLRT